MQEGSRRVERLSYLMDENNGRYLTEGKKEMRSPGKCEEENLCQIEEGALA